MSIHCSPYRKTRHFFPSAHSRHRRQALGGLLVGAALSLGTWLCTPAHAQVAAPHVQAQEVLARSQEMVRYLKFRLALLDAYHLYCLTPEPQAPTYVQFCEEVAVLVQKFSPMEKGQ